MLTHISRARGFRGGKDKRKRDFTARKDKGPHSGTVLSECVNKCPTLYTRHPPKGKRIVDKGVGQLISSPNSDAK